MITRWHKQEKNKVTEVSINFRVTVVREPKKWTFIIISTSSNILIPQRGHVQQRHSHWSNVGFNIQYSAGVMQTKDLYGNLRNTLVHHQSDLGRSNLLHWHEGSVQASTCGSAPYLNLLLPFASYQRPLAGVDNSTAFSNQSPSRICQIPI